MENTGHLLLSFPIILSASLVQGATAFGFALIALAEIGLNLFF